MYISWKYIFIPIISKTEILTGLEEYEQIYVCVLTHLINLHAYTYILKIYIALMK